MKLYQRKMALHGRSDEILRMAKPQVWSFQKGFAAGWVHVPLPSMSERGPTPSSVAITR